MRSRNLRWMLALAGLPVLVAAGAFSGLVGYVLWQQPLRLTENEFDRLQVGMSRTEVESILGGPPGDYTTAPVASPFGPGLTISNGWPAEALSGWPQPLNAGKSVTWLSDTGAVTVGFDDSASTVAARFTVLSVLPQGVIDTVRWRIGRQWRRRFPE